MTVKFLGLGLAGYLVAMLPLQAIASPEVAVAQVDWQLPSILMGFATVVAFSAVMSLPMLFILWFPIAARGFASQDPKEEQKRRDRIQEYLAAGRKVNASSVVVEQRWEGDRASGEGND